MLCSCVAPDAAGAISSESGNVVVLASDRPRTWKAYDPDQIGAAAFDQAETARFAAGGKLLRDDYAPVDQLLTPPPDA